MGTFARCLAAKPMANAAKLTRKASTVMVPIADPAIWHLSTTCSWEFGYTVLHNYLQHMYGRPRQKFATPPCQKCFSSLIFVILYTNCNTHLSFIFSPFLTHNKLWQLRLVTCVCMAHNVSAIAAATVGSCEPTNTHPSFSARFRFNNNTSITTAISLVSQWYHRQMPRHSDVCNASIHVMAMSPPHMVHKRLGAKKSTKT
jgi:hypothetical protein